MLSFAQIAALNQQERDDWVLSRIKRYFEPGTRVLDIGAGTSPYKEALARHVYIAHDFGRYEGVKLDGTTQYAPLDIQSDILCIPLDDESIDHILCTEVLEHVPEPAKAITEFTRLLRPGGRMMLTAPFTSGIHQEPYHFYSGFSHYFYRYVAEQNRLRVVELSQHGGFLRLMAQEMGRVASAYSRAHSVLPQPAIEDRTRTLHILANELLNLENLLPMPQFSIGYHVILEKPSSED